MHMFDTYKLKPGYKDKDKAGCELRDKLLASVPKKKLPLQVKIALTIMTLAASSLLIFLLVYALPVLIILVAIFTIAWAGVTVCEYF